jgi:hypothetical protein
MLYLSDKENFIALCLITFKVSSVSLSKLNPQRVANENQIATFTICAHPLTALH